MNEFVSTRQLNLDLRQVAATERVSRNLLAGLHRAELSEYQDIITDTLIARLNAYVLAEHLADETRTFTFTWPDGPWQRFKAKHLPTFTRWRLLRPAKERTEHVTVEVKSWATFPESTVRIPEMGAPVYFQDVSAS